MEAYLLFMPKRYLNEILLGEGLVFCGELEKDIGLYLLLSIILIFLRISLFGLIGGKRN